MCNLACVRSIMLCQASKTTPATTKPAKKHRLLFSFSIYYMLCPNCYLSICKPSLQLSCIVYILFIYLIYIFIYLIFVEKEG